MERYWLVLILTLLSTRYWDTAEGNVVLLTPYCGDGGSDSGWGSGSGSDDDEVSTAQPCSTITYSTYDVSQSLYPSTLSTSLVRLNITVFNVAQSTTHVRTQLSSDLSVAGVISSQTPPAPTATLGTDVNQTGVSLQESVLATVTQHVVTTLSDSTSTAHSLPTETPTQLSTLQSLIPTVKSTSPIQDAPIISYTTTVVITANSGYTSTPSQTRTTTLFSQTSTFSSGSLMSLIPLSTPSPTNPTTHSSLTKLTHTPSVSQSLVSRHTTSLETPFFGATTTVRIDLTLTLLSEIPGQSISSTYPNTSTNTVSAEPSEPDQIFITSTPVYTLSLESLPLQIATHTLATYSDAVSSMPVIASHVTHTADITESTTQLTTGFITQTSTLLSGVTRVTSDSVGSVPAMSSEQSSSHRLYIAVGTSVGACISIASVIIVIILAVVVRRKRRQQYQGTFYTIGESRRPSLSESIGLFNLSLAQVDGLSYTQLSRASLASIPPMIPTSPMDVDKAIFDEKLDGAYKSTTFKRSELKNSCLKGQPVSYRPEPPHIRTSVMYALPLTNSESSESTILPDEPHVSNEDEPHVSNEEMREAGDEREEPASDEREETVCDEREETAGDEREEERVCDEREGTACDERKETTGDEREETAGDEREGTVSKDSESGDSLSQQKEASQSEVHTSEADVREAEIETRETNSASVSVSDARDEDEQEAKEAETSPMTTEVEHVLTSVPVTTDVSNVDLRNEESAMLHCEEMLSDKGSSHEPAATLPKSNSHDNTFA